MTTGRTITFRTASPEPISGRDLLRKKRPKQLTADEAQQFGIKLEPNWLVRFDYGKDGDEPKQIFVSPDKWEFSDLVYGDKGELRDYIALSPEGKAFNKAELEQLEVAPTEVQPVQPEGFVFDYATGQFVPATAEQVAEREAFAQQFPEIAPPGTPGKITPQEFQQRQTDILRAVYPEMFDPARSFGFTEEEIPGMVRDVLQRQATENQEAFVKDIVSKGRTPETEQILGMFFQVTPGDIDRLFLGPEPSKEAVLFQKALPLLVTQRNTEVMVDYFFDNPDVLRRSLIGTGRNADTEALVKTLYPLITDKGLTYFFNPRAPGTVEGIPSEALGALPTKTWLDKVQEVRDDPTQLIPFVASGVEIIKIGKLLKTAKDLEDGKEISQEDLLELRDYVARATMDTTWGFEVLDVIAQIVPFAGEFIATGGIFSAGRTATVKAAEQALKRIATRTGLRILEGRLAKFGVEVAGIVGGGTLRTIPAGVTRIPATTLEKQLVSTLTGDEEAVWESALKAFGEQWVEVVSESTGGLFRVVTAPIKGQLIKIGIFKAFQKANPAAKAGDVKRVFEKLGYHGILEEMLEERVADVGHGILEPLGLSDQEFSIPSLRQLSVELVAFSVPGAAAIAIQSTPGVLEKLTPRVKKAIADVAEQARIAPEAGFVRIPGEKPEEIRHKGTEPEGIKIADELGVRYEGIQKGIGEIPSVKMFTDVQQTGSTFTGNTLEEARTKLVSMREAFEAPTAELGIPAISTEQIWNSMEVEERVSLVKQANLEGKLGSKKWVDLNTKEQDALRLAREEIAPAIPRAEVGMPEAGIQPSMIPEVPAKEVRPKGKGREIQISMEDQLKLDQARRDAEEALPEVREAFEAQAEIEGLKVTLETDPVATARFKLGGKNVDLTAFISIREQTFPETFTVKQAEAIKPFGNYGRYTQRGSPSYNKVPKDEVLDELADKWNMTPDEIAERVMAIRQEKNKIKSFEQEIKEQFTKKPLTKLPEPTAEELTSNLATTGQPTLTPKQIVRTLELFGKYVESESTVDAWQLTRDLRRETRSARAENLKSRAQELIVSEGKSAEDAMKQAITETMAGELPAISTDYLSDLTETMRDTLFSKVYQTLKDEPFEMMSTLTALTNALIGKPIPRELGVTGKSAFTRLQRVFGDQPKVLKALDKMAKEKKPLEEIIEGIFHETEREPIPLDQEMVEYLRGLSSIPNGYKTLLEAPFNNPVVSDLRTPADLAFALRELELGRELAEGKINFDEFQLKRLEARDKAFPLPPVPKFDAPIDKAFKIPPMFNFMEQGIFNRTLKEILWSPLDIGNFLRANKASLDNSYLRQSKLLLSGHPVIAWQAHTTAWQSMFSQKHAEAEWELITKDPEFQIYEQIRVETGHDPLRVPAYAATKGTEQWRTSEEFGFTRQDVKRVIPRFTAWLPHVKYSERAFSAGTNKAVWGVWKQKLAFARRYLEKIASGDVKLKEGESFDIIQEMTDEQAMLGNMIQRANLRRFSGLAPAINAFFFAARSKIGRFLVPIHLIGITFRRGKVGFNPRIMKEAWRDFLLMNAYIGGLMFLGDWLDLWDTETDPRNAEFLSARIGKIRIDPWAGHRQFVVLYARLVTGTGISSVTGAEYDANPLKAMQSFVINSLSPIASILLEFWTGRNFLGQVIDYADKKYWIEKVSPFSANDVWEAFEGEGWKGAAITTIPAIYGEGVQTYTGEWEENHTKLGLPKYIENTGVGIFDPRYDSGDFWSDTANQFKGVDPETLTEAKGYPTYVKAMAEAQQTMETTDFLPNEKLISINADPEQGKTFVDYHEIWLGRQNLVDAGDEAEYTISELQPDGKYKEVTYKGEEAVEAFDKKEGQKPAQSRLGNISQAQYALLLDYWSADEEEQKEILEKHPELGENPYHEWYKSHPKENAILAVHGKMDVLTEDAYNLAVQMAKEWDYPDSAISPYLPPKDVVKPYFEREQAVREFGGNSAESMLILAREPELLEWYQEQAKKKGEDPLDTPEQPIRYYELKAKNRAEREYMETLKDKESPGYIEDDDERREAFYKQFPESEYFDDQRRTEAIANGFDDKQIEAWVERGQLVDKYSAGSPKTKEWAFDHPSAYRKALEENILKDKGALPTDEERGHYEQWVEPAIRLQAKNIEQDAYWEELGDKTSETYIKDEDERREAFFKKYPGSEYFDDLERIEAFKAGFTEAEATLWAKRGQVVVKYEPQSAESKIWLVDHKDVWDKALEAELLTDDGSDWNVPSLRITAKYRKEDAEYDAIPGDDREARDAYLADHEDYRKDRRRREAHQMVNSVTGEKIPVDQVENFVSYHEIDVKGKRQERFLVENSEFAEGMHNIAGIDIPKPQDVPTVQYDDIYDQYPEQFDELEGLADNESEFYVEDTKERDAKRKGLRFNPDGTMTEFGLAEIRRDAYGKFVPEEQISDYVGYYIIIGEGKPENYEEINKTDLWYDDDWFLLEHSEFYQQVYKILLGNQKKDFSKVPPREVFSKYLEYLTLNKGKERDDFRWDNLDLDDWLVLKFDYTPIVEQRRRAALTAGERLQLTIQEMERRLREHP